MNKFTRSSVAIMLVLTFVLVMLAISAAGCRQVGSGDDLGAPSGNGGSASFVPPEFVYIAQAVPMPGDLGRIHSLAFIDGMLYFAVNIRNYDEETLTDSSTYSMYSMNIDGSDLALLAEHVPPIESPPDTFGGVSINRLSVDGDGNLWVVERYEYYTYDLPESFDPERDEMWEHYREVAAGNFIRKLSPQGAELLSLDLSSIEGQRGGSLWVRTFGVDGAGNAYACFEDYEAGGRVIHVFNDAGIKQFELATEIWFNDFVRMVDGSIAFSSEEYDETGYRLVLQQIDFSAKSFGSSIDLPSVSRDVFSGGRDFDVLISDNNNIYGFLAGEDEAVKLINWIESDIISDDISNITMISDGRVMCTNRTRNHRTGESNFEILILTRTPYSELPEKTILTCATIGVQPSIRDAIVMFNRESPDYRIHVIDYAEFNTADDRNAGLTRLSAEITAGKIPDIMDVTSLPYNEYASKGLLADLYPFIDADPDYGRDDFVQGAFRAAEIDGKLYQVFPSFTIQTLVGNPSVVGEGVGWNMDEFQAVLDAHPEADMPLGQWLTKTTFMQTSVAFGINKYINWEAGTAHFDTPEFIQLLEYANRLPDDIDWGDPGINWDDFVYEEEAIPAGRQIMAQTTLAIYAFSQYYKEIFGGEIIFKGFPNEDRNGNALQINIGLAITEKSPHKDAAWSFVRTVLSEDVQLDDYSHWGFPTNHAVFDVQAAEEMAMEKGYHDINGIEIEPPTQADVDAILALINSASGTTGWNPDPKVWEIVSESIADYFSGVCSAEDAARVIQSRVSIYVSERS